MSKRTSFSPSKAAKAALGTKGFIAHTRELLESEAWRRRSIHAVRILDCLELEHLAHAGKQNAFLRSTYTQFHTYGINRRFINPGIEECVSLGLLKITHKGGYSGAGRLDPSTYQLTYLPWKFNPATGPPQYLEPTNEWKNFVAAKPARKPRPCTNGPSPNGHDPAPASQQARSMTTAMTKKRERERQRQRYLETNTHTYGLRAATERWTTYERLLLEKYGGVDLDAAWKARDYAHR